MLDWVPSYRAEWLRADIVAGLTTCSARPPTTAFKSCAGWMTHAI
jgi:hypothetical protein